MNDNDESFSFVVKGKNPQLFVEKIVRERIYESTFWKQHCFAVNASTILDKAYSLTSIGGTFANIRPSEFICLLFKLLLINPDVKIIYEYIQQTDFKYIRALGAFLLRLVGDAVDVYTKLEPLLADYRKLRFRNSDGTYSLTYMDEFIDSLLHEERVCDIILPRLPKRELLEELGQLEERNDLVHELNDKEDKLEEEQILAMENERVEVKKKKGAALKFKQKPSAVKEQEKKDLSIDETNKLRASLGLAPLKQ